MPWPSCLIPACPLITLSVCALSTGPRPIQYCYPDMMTSLSQGQTFWQGQTANLWLATGCNCQHIWVHKPQVNCFSSENILWKKVMTSVANITESIDQKHVYVGSKKLHRKWWHHMGHGNVKYIYVLDLNHGKHWPQMEVKHYRQV